MLNQLKVKNYALIEDLVLDLGQELSIITGETGAGKSILLGALGLLLGQRADSKTLRNPEKKCVVEGLFLHYPKGVDDYLSSEDFDIEEELIIRREILPSGKSRAFINDSPAQVSQLKTIGEWLIDVHSQHQTLHLKSNDYHLEVLDTYAGLAEDLREYQGHYKHYQGLSKDLKRAESQLEASQGELEFKQFQHQELLDLQLKEDEELQSLEEQLSFMDHAEFLKSHLHDACVLLDEEHLGIQEKMHVLRGHLDKMAAKHNKYEAWQERVQSLYLEVEDLSRELLAENDQLEFDPALHEELQGRYDILQRAFIKFKVDNISGLKDLKNKLEVELEAIQFGDEHLDEMRKQLKEVESTLAQSAETLSKKRIAAFSPLKTALEEICHQLGMPNAFLDLKQERIPFNSTGQDAFTLMFTANKGMPVKPLHESASGGELSRLMLALKRILAQSKSLPSIIFDEIDTGVSGEIAGKMGDIMHEMGRHMQVLAITHLPQIAAKGQSHFKVFKIDEEGKTTTKINKLSDLERIEEIAGMLSGANPSQAALANARDLLKQ